MKYLLKMYYRLKMAYYRKKLGTLYRKITNNFDNVSVKTLLHWRHKSENIFQKIKKVKLY